MAGPRRRAGTGGAEETVRGRHWRGQRDGTHAGSRRRIGPEARTERAEDRAPGGVPPPPVPAILTRLLPVLRPTLARGAARRVGDRVQALDGDWRPARFADPVAALLQPLEGALDRGEDP